ncbi:MAG: hypothetical protein ABUK01_11760 [Leptospirales bacterium]
METQKISVIECGWCDQPNKVGESTHCTFCSGPLPTPPGETLAEAPPSTPRKLPANYLAKRCNEDYIIKISKVFIYVFFWSIIFPIVGFFAWRNTKKKIMHQIKALEEGLAVEGQIIDVYRDTSLTVNGRNPWAMVYTFETKVGQLLEGTISSWDLSIPLRKPGEKTWVVYVAEEPEINSIWPPIKK